MNRKTLLMLGALALLVMIPAISYAGKPVKVLYWNVQNGMWDGQNDNYQRFVDWVKGQKADICVWCEAQKIYKTDTDTNEFETAEAMVARWKRLATAYGHKYMQLSAHRDRYPQLITSRYPIKMDKLIVGNKDTLVIHGASQSVIRIGKKEIHLVTLHTWPARYSYYQREPEQQAMSIAENGGNKFRAAEMKYICENTLLASPGRDNEYWMMMGDFNSLSRRDAPAYAGRDIGINETSWLTHDYIINNTPYVDIIYKMNSGKFMKTTGDGKRLDFIYVTPALADKVVKATTVWDGYTTPVRDFDSNGKALSNFWRPSDHTPLVMLFRP